MSTAISRATYDDQTQTLTVWFRKGGTHVYENVPPDLGKSFAANPSGGTFNEEIRNAYS